MATYFPLSEQARPTDIGSLLEKSRISLDSPKHLAIVTTKDGKFVVAGQGAPDTMGPVDVRATAPGSTTERRIVGTAYQVINARLFSIGGALAITVSSASGAGAMAAFLSGNWKAGLALTVAAGWAGAIAAGEYMKQAKDGLAARRQLRAEGIDLAQVPPPEESSFAEILARSSIPY